MKSKFIATALVGIACMTSSSYEASASLTNEYNNEYKDILNYKKEKHKTENAENPSGENEKIAACRRFGCL